MATVFDLFCGTGGFSYGFEKASPEFETRFGIDVLQVATQTFKANHRSANVVCGDIRKLRRKQVEQMTGLGREEVDVIVGGPPCQGFSSIRPFRSSDDDDPRNSLFEEFASFVNYFRPKVFVIENVVGIATYKDGRTVEEMEACFKRLGYASEWRILNAANYGIPQKRERFVMIGAQQGKKIQFPIPTHMCSGKTIGYRDRARMVRSSQSDLFIPPVELSAAVTVMDAISDLPIVSAGDEALSYDAAL